MTDQPLPDGDDGLSQAIITVLGVGNPIMGDDGVGLALLAAVEAASQTAHPGADIEFVDGGTGGMELLPVVQEAQHLLILDAVAGSTPGQVVVLTGDQIPRLLSSKLSPHQVGLLDVFAAARLLGREPGVVSVVGVVPAIIDLATELSPIVAGALPEASARAMAVIRRWLDEPGASAGVAL